MNSFSLYPNPTNNNIELSSQKSLLGETIIIYNYLGQISGTETLKNQFTNEIQLPDPNDVYFLAIDGQTLKVIKQ